MQSRRFQIIRWFSSLAICLIVLSLLINNAVLAAPNPEPSNLSNMLEPAGLSAALAGCSFFPANNIWNARIDSLPVHALSNQWVDNIGRTTGFHMDFGSGTWDGGPIGIPFNIVDGSIPKVPVSFYYPDESDPGPYPIPVSPLIEFGSDHHILIVDSSTCILYEIYDASYSGGSWQAGSGAIWNLNSNNLRPDTWTSADAAGLPMLPGLVRYDEIVSGSINHAIRFTASQTNGYIWPARHLTANDAGAAQIPPMGARFRLKAGFDISGFPSEMQVILRAMKNYGIILADNGADWYVSGAPDPRWDNDMLHLLDVLSGNDFEAVDASALKVNNDSGQTNTSVLVPPVVTASEGTDPAGVNVSWAASSGATSYIAYRSERLDGEKIPTSGVSILGLSGADVWAIPGITYYYWVKACDASGCSELSTPEPGWRGITPPVVTASDGTYADKVLVSWPAVSGATSYLAFRSESLGGVKIPEAGLVISSPGGADIWASPGVTYTYWVKACNDSHCSDFSSAETGWRGH